MGSARALRTAWNEVIVVFSGSDYFKANSISGSIDRVTGDVEATSMATDVKKGRVITSLVYALKCRPTQRMF
jgi:hypothetical protein